MYEQMDATATVITCDYPNCGKTDTSFRTSSFRYWAGGDVEWKNVYIGPGQASEAVERDPSAWYTLCPAHAEYVPLLRVIKDFFDRADRWADTSSQ